MIGITNASIASSGESSDIEIVNIFITTNQISHEALLGTTITLSYGSYKEDIIWEGTEITRGIPANNDYTITYGVLENYIVPKSVTYKSVQGNSRSVSGIYNTTKVTISLKTNQSSHTDVTNANVIIDGKTIKNGQVIYLLPNSTYTAIFQDVTNYKTPDSQQFTTSSSSMTLSATYQCELVTVNGGINVSSDGEGFGFIISKSKLIEGSQYYQLDYIESTGQQYIDTGFKPNSTTKIYYDFQFTKTNGGYSGLHSSNTGRLMFGMTSNFEIYFGNTTNSSNVATTERTNITFDIPNKKVSVNGTNVIQNQTYTADGKMSLPLFAYRFDQNTGNELREYAYMKLYSCKIYNSNTLIHNYVPALGKDGSVGLYDTITQTFKASNTATPLVAGNQVLEPIQTQTDYTATYKIPFGDSYTVQALPVDNYHSPESQTYIANQKTRTINMTYLLATQTLTIYVSTSDGSSLDGTSVYVQQYMDSWRNVYIYDTNGVLHDYYNINNDTIKNITPVGIYIKNYGILMALDDIDVNKWGDQVSVPELTTTVDKNTALSDMAGQDNTSKIVSYFTQKDSAAEKCNEYIFLNGKRGYLGSAGEWQIIANQLYYINDILRMFGRESLSGNYWTSTQYNDVSSWSVNIDGNNKIFNYNTKGTSCKIRPITTIDPLFQEIKPIVNGRAVFNIPYYMQYKVQAGENADIEGYVTPDATIHTATNATNDVVWNFSRTSGVKHVTNGIWIQDEDRYYFNPNNWSTATYKKAARGVAVINDTDDFLVTLQDTNSYCWGNPDVTEGYYNVTESNQPTGDYEYRCSVSDYQYWTVFDACNNVPGCVGGGGYWYLISNNLNAINSALSKCGGSQISTSTNYWTSTEYGGDYSNWYAWYVRISRQGDYSFTWSSKDDQYPTRPIGYARR